MRHHAVYTVLGWLGLSLASLLAGCGDSSGSGRRATSCEASSECDLGASSAGQLCVEGACQACEADADCAQDPHYGAGATCQEGRCAKAECDPGSVGCPCGEDDACDGSAECVEGQCVECERGALDCACMDNGSCDQGLRCQDALCVTCQPEQEGCPCGEGDACADGLACQAGLCVKEGCEPGQDACPCAPNDACADGLTCGEDGLCRPCSSDIAGCPCDEEGACEVGLVCDEDELCAECDPETAGCPCDEEGACGGGLVCDPQEELCRLPLGCVDLTCGDQQRCGQTPGQDAACLEECLPGFVWDGAQGRCVADGPSNCQEGSPDSLAEDCEALSRACVEEDGGARCGDCLDGTTDEGGALATCRPVVDCAALACEAQNRLCAQPNPRADALCGDCAPGFEEQQGACVALGQTTCLDDGSAGSLADDCAALGRACEEPVAGQARCAGCLSDLIPSDLDDPQSLCRAPITCQDRAQQPALACDPGLRCVQLDPAQDSACQTRLCPDDAAFNATTQRCEVCVIPQRCDATGETGSYAELRTEDGQCVCETEQGFYADLGEAARARRCDRDGDGWVGLPALEALESLDPVIRENARCELSYIDRFVLQNEWGQRKELYACQGAEPLAEGCAVNQRLLLPLVEPKALDDANAFDTLARDEPNRLPRFQVGAGNGLRGRALRTEELNPLTKACVGPNGDFNLNGYPDRSEFHGQATANGLAEPLRPFPSLAFFMELHRSWFEPSDDAQGCEPGQRCGRYVIAERSRRELNEDGELSFPLGYGSAEGMGEGRSEYWRDCTRSRDSAFTSDPQAEEPMGSDFGRWTCAGASGTCATPPAPPLLVGPVEAVPLHGLGDFDALDPALPWRGMTHASQFKCVLVDNTINLNDPGRRQAQHRLHRNELFDGASNAPWVAQRCAPACPDNDPTCAGDCPGIDCDQATEDCSCRASDEEPSQGPNPHAPRLRCEPVDTQGEWSDVQENVVVLAAARYLHGDGRDIDQDYVRGCINEWRPRPDAQAITPWRSLCPGYVERPGAINGLANPADFGKLLCGCSVNHGGITCEDGCSQPLYGGNADDLLCQAFYGYCPVLPRDEGGRSGAWICGSVGTTYSPNPVLQGGGLKLQGEVTHEPLRRTPMCPPGHGDCFVPEGGAPIPGPVIR